MSQHREKGKKVSSEIRSGIKALGICLLLLELSEVRKTDSLIKHFTRRWDGLTGI